MVKRAAAVVFVVCAVAALALVAAPPGTIGRLKDRVAALRGAGSAGHPQNTSPAKHAAVESTLVAGLLDLEAKPSDISVRSASGDSGVVISARVPLGPPIEWVIWSIARSLAGTPFRVVDCRQNQKDWLIVLRSPSRARPVRVVLTRASHFYSATARLALVIENFGFDTNRSVIEILAFPQPLTVSVMPSGRQASWTAQVAGEYKKEIILLVPMEPEFRVSSDNSPAMILVHYPEDKIREMVQDYMNRVPNFAGLSNYLGSRALADSRVMGIVMGEAKKRHAYFLEIRDGRRSVAAATAARLKVPYTFVNIRPPATAAQGEIDDAICRAVTTAQSRGSLVLGLPSTAATIAVLKRKLPFFKANGARLVLVSELVED